MGQHQEGLKQLQAALAMLEKLYPKYDHPDKKRVQASIEQHSKQLPIS